MPRKALMIAALALSITVNASFAQETAPTIPAQTAPQTVTGQIQVVQPAAITPAATLSAADYLDIKATAGDEKSNIRQYTLNLQNKQAKHIEILQLEVVNGITEQAFAQMQQEKSRARRQLAGGMLRGLTSVATSFIPYAGIGSMAAYHGIAAGATAMNAVADTVQNASGTTDYTGKVVQRASNIIITPNQNFNCLALVPGGQAPVVKVIFKDLQTNQIFDIQK